jgi:hypothetical protein
MKPLTIEDIREFTEENPLLLKFIELFKFVEIRKELELCDRADD